MLGNTWQHFRFVAALKVLSDIFKANNDTYGKVHIGGTPMYWFNIALSKYEVINFAAFY